MSTDFDHFDYEVRIDLSEPIPVDEVGAIVELSVRHFAPYSIPLGQGSDRNQVRVGFRLYPGGAPHCCFEDRGWCVHSSLEPGVWAPFLLRIPRQALDFTTEYRLFIDLVREGQ